MTLRLAIVSFSFVLLAGGIATGQTSRPTKISPAEQMLNQMLNVGGALPTTRPTAPAAGSTESITPPAVEPAETILNHAMREGTFIRRTGILSRPKDEPNWELVSPSGSTIRISPNLRLMQIEDALSIAGAGTTLNVTGYVTEYRGRNFLLIDSWNRVAATIPTSKPTEAKSSVEQTIDQMLGAGGSKTTIASRVPTTQDRSTGPGSLAPNALSLAVLREGRMITDRVGRLTTSNSGQTYEFAFDADSKNLRDPPVIILPQGKLQQMEDAVRSSARDPRFRISGTVTEYRGRNYILLLKAVAIPEFADTF